MVFDWNYRLGVDKDGDSYGSFDGSIGGVMSGGEFDDLQNKNYMAYDSGVCGDHSGIFKR